MRSIYPAAPLRFLLLFCMGIVCSAVPLAAQWVQQGPKLASADTGLYRRGYSVALSADGNTALLGGGNGAEVWVRSGTAWTLQAALPGPETDQVASAGAVALSADGNTALVGAPGDDGEIGSVQVWIRSGGAWTRQGPKLVGAGFSPGFVGQFVAQGTSVALSADGNTALIGGPGDSDQGAAWVWTRSNGLWTQQGPKLVVLNVSQLLFQGSSVSLSADGNTALIGDPGDDTFTGALHVWVRGGGVWTYQSKLPGPTAWWSSCGFAVALSADGNTAIGGAPGAQSNTGAAWLWTRAGNTWNPGPSLTGHDAPPAVLQGFAVALSSDGNTAFIGAPNDGTTGTVRVFTKANGVWQQEGPPLAGTGSVGGPRQGSSIALSSDAATALVGGPMDNLDEGGAWVFVRPFDDVSSRLLVTVSPVIPGRDRGSPYWTMSITVASPAQSPTRSGRAEPIPGPILVVLTNLSPNATLVNASGMYAGSPYITVSDKALAPGNAVTALLEFTNATGGPITFTAVSYSAP